VISDYSEPDQTLQGEAKLTGNGPINLNPYADKTSLAFHLVIVISFQIMEPPWGHPPLNHSAKPLTACNLLIINSGMFGWLCAVALPLLGQCGQDRVGTIGSRWVLLKESAR
jgi:hypothetical protein